jgi:hypothetical protein
MAKGLRGSVKGKRDDDDRKSNYSSSGSSASGPVDPVEPTKPVDPVEPDKENHALKSDSSPDHSIQKFSEEEYKYDFSLNPLPDGTCNVSVKRLLDGEVKTENFPSKELANQFIIQCQNSIAEELEKHRQAYAEEMAKIKPISSPDGSTVAPAPVEESSLPNPLTPDELIISDLKGNILHVIPELAGMVRKWLGDSEKVAAFGIQENGSIVIVSYPSYQKCKFFFSGGKPGFVNI